MFGRESPGRSADPYAADRRRMIEDQLRRRGVVMHSVLAAMEAIPRHLFVEHRHSDRAYYDEALPSLEGQTISQPFMVAIMTQELAIHPGQRILELGTGTGYQTAVLAYVAGPEGQVFTIERLAALTEFARRRLDALDIRNVRYHKGDGSAGWPREPWDGPRSAAGEPLFDRILVTAGAPEVPAPLLGQLAQGGVLVIPLGDTDSQMLTRVVREQDRWRYADVLGCRFVPLVGQHAWPAPM